MKKQIAAVALTAALAVQLLPMGAFAQDSQIEYKPLDAGDPTKVVALDGDWNFKLYRTYDQMFQYQPHGMSHVVWEDNEVAALPEKADFEQWEVVQMPADDVSTGGLLPLERPVAPSTPESAKISTGESGVPSPLNDFDPMSVFLPKWSEAWVCRTFEVPADFTTDENVTLLLGVIDDADVIYVNGTPLVSSGFQDGAKKPILNDRALGGFEKGVVNFEKSYWEVSREYTIPASALNLGEENEIAIRLFNNNGNGGFYSGKPYALCGNALAVRAAKGLPTQETDVQALRDVVSNQSRALVEKNAEDYGLYVHEDYVNDGKYKNDRIQEIADLLNVAEVVTVTDTNPGYYVDGERYWYSAKRTIKTSSEPEKILFDEDVEICYIYEDGKMYEIGNQSHCYNTSYYSELFSKNLTYSVYLPPSYFTDTDKQYPVVYLLHGINSTSNSFINVDHIESFMNDLIEDGKIMEMIVVMPDSGKNAFYRDTPLPEGYNPASTSTDNVGPWATQTTQELRELIDETYRTYDDVKLRGLTGISMGGGGAFNLGASNPELYSSVASHMGYLSTENQAPLRALSDSQLANYDFYLDCGTEDIMVDYKDTVAVHEYLTSKGIEHGYDLRPGGHNSAFYMKSMDRSMIMHSEHFKKALESYKVTFNTNGGTSVPVQNVAYKGKVVKPANPSKAGCNFAGWYSNASLTKAFDFNTVIKANTTLYAKWTVKTSSITSINKRVDGVRLNFASVPGVTYYHIYRYNAATKTYTWAAKSTVNYWVDSNPASGKTTSYAVRVQVGSAYSAYSAVKSVDYLATPQITSVTNVLKGMQVSWKAVPGAVTYHIYRYDPATKAYNWAAKTTSTSWVDGKAASGTTARYAVRVQGKTGYSAYSNVVAKFCVATPKISSIRRLGTGVKLNWTASKGAGTYHIYRYDSATKKYVWLGKTNSTSFTYTKAPKGVTWYYAVRAQSGSIYSKYSTAIGCK